VSQEFGSAVVDTVALQYFLLARRGELLVELLGAPLHTPRIVFDPDEVDVPLESRSELTRGIEVLSRRAVKTQQPPDSRHMAHLKATRLSEVLTLYRHELISIVDMTTTERALAGQLNSRHHVAEFQLRFPLGLGEAACVAVAYERDWTLVTDDTAGLQAVLHLHPEHRYARIRRLLQRAAETGAVTRKEANAIHREMTAFGFWDRVLPYPEDAD